MSSLGLGPPPPHPTNPPQNLRISPQTMAAAISPQSMSGPNLRLSPSQQNQGTLSIQQSSQSSLQTRHSPSQQQQQHQQQQQNNTNHSITPPQNLSISPSPHNRSTPNTSNSPLQLNDNGSNDHHSQINNNAASITNGSTENITGNNNRIAKDNSALNMSMATNTPADMRSNSIATLRIKAKEHLESINKGLTMV